MIVGMRHAMYAGWIVGLALDVGLDVEPVVDPLGNYTDRIALQVTSGRTIELVVPPPPDDWVLP